MDEINEQTENMKQIQEALSAPLGAAADFDEVVLHRYPFLSFFLVSHFGEKILFSFVLCRMNWRRSLKNSKELSWRTSFCNLQQQLLLPLFESLLEDNRQRELKTKTMNSLNCRGKWPFDDCRVAQHFVFIFVFLATLNLCVERCQTH